MTVKNLSSLEEFAEITINHDKLVIDFWAPWCAPCNTLSPLFDRIAKTLPSNVKALKANVDELPILAQKFGIKTIPTVIVLENSEIKAQSSGLISEQALKQLVA
ncbi:thioredoxin fold domain-containing protein [Thalassotalea sp. M1531]|uniref:Thioredoxin n=1 Tax=Thalassotalea algicola TaxID=2716224 RepID=A0A7Y0Q7R0_9GAMM|nr:thioredoxin domain-containing protein [Thalassotalea algicola]NMP31295.1 thioredoxin fold domain-containing protein [Thalassotalea algicola]